MSHMSQFRFFARRPIRQLGADQSGVAMVIAAMALVVLLGFCGLAIDVVMWEVNQRGMQGAADQAALAGATAYRNAGETTPLGNNAMATEAAYATAIRAGYPAASAPGNSVCSDPGGHSGVAVCPYTGGTTCTGTGSSAGCIQVTITQDQQRYFTGIFSNSAVTVTVAAVGTCVGCGNGNSAVGTGGGNPCVMALDASGKGVITDQGGAIVSLTNCNLYNNSPNTTATVVTNNATIEGCSVTDACGSKAFLAQPDMPTCSNSNSSAQCIDIPVITSSAPAPDPYANLPPPTVGSSCISSFPANPVPSGTYCPGNINNQNVVFAAGAVIVITGGLSTKGNSTISCPPSGSAAGSGCTLYVLGGGSINANSTVGITSPSSGTYAGISIWYGDDSAVTWNGANSSDFKGAIYAPQADVTYAGNVASASTCTRLIAAAIDFTGTSSAAFNNSGCPAVAGPVLTSSGSGGPASSGNTGSPVLVQ